MRQTGRFGEFGGVFVPQILVPALEELEAGFLDSVEDEDFSKDLCRLLRDYAGRPTPLYLCRNLPGESRIYLKREDLLHGGAHKTNQVLGQGLLALRLGKRRLIAETGAGQHGVATAMAGALFQLPTTIYMGARDMERQQPNVRRMELLGAKVVPVRHGAQTLKEAINEALRDWAATFEDTHYLLGTAAGPHPYPTMVREFQRVIGREARQQFLEAERALPSQVIACVGGGSNAIGIFSDFVADEKVQLVGVEPAGKGLSTAEHGATLSLGRVGILHGTRSYVLQDSQGQIRESHSISAGLDYPGVGPEHAYLRSIGRAEYCAVTDHEAVQAFLTLSKLEGIIPALESAHAVAEALRRSSSSFPPRTIIVNLSGRGDKDLDHLPRELAGVRQDGPEPSGIP